MKTFLILMLGLSLVASTQAIAPVAPPAASPLTTDQLDQLLGPLALYPDSLIALILPASTVTSDIVLAVRYQSTKGDPAQIPNQTWDSSVKSLARYPNILQWLNQNLEWTTQLGDAFLSQPADVMDAIQQLRAQAKAAGHLVSTTQQQVVVDNGDISIEPANPQMIYVPQYDPDSIYDDGGYADGDPFITFGMGYAVGAWLNYGMDWRHHGLYMGDWGTGMDYRGRGSGDYGTLTNPQRWHPGAGSVMRERRTANQGTRVISHTQPLPGVAIPHGTARPGMSMPALFPQEAAMQATPPDYRGVISPGGALAALPLRRYRASGTRPPFHLVRQARSPARSTRIAGVVTSANPATADKSAVNRRQLPQSTDDPPRQLVGPLRCVPRPPQDPHPQPVRFM